MLEDGGSMFLRNFSIYLQVHMALQSKRPTSTPPPPSELLSALKRNNFHVNIRCVFGNLIFACADRKW